MTVSGVHEQDRDLLADLGRVALSADPPPDAVVELARAAFALHRLDAELACLVADSAQELVGVRSSGDDVRLLSFLSGGLGVDLQVSGGPERRTLVGQVVPPPAAGRVRLESAGGGVHGAELDEIGCFRIEEVASGLHRLHLTGDTGPVVTEWSEL